jgi:hypothetical protein
MRGGFFKGSQEIFAQIQVDRLFADTYESAVEIFPEANAQCLFNVGSGLAINLFDITVVEAIAIRPEGPIQQFIGFFIKKQICVQNEKFVTGRKSHGIHKLEEQIVPWTILQTGRMGLPKSRRDIISLGAGNKANAGKFFYYQIFFRQPQRTILMNKQAPWSAGKIFETQNGEQAHSPSFGGNQHVD